MRPREGSLSEVGEAIEKYLRSHGMVRHSRESVVPLLWAEVVGEWYSHHTQVLRVDGGVVTVRCDSASRAQQLDLDAPHIISVLNARLGGKTIKEIRASSGGIRRSGALPESPAPIEWPSRFELDEMVLEPQEMLWVQETVAEITGDELRQVLESVLVKQAKLRSWKREHGYAPCRGCGGLIPPGRTMCMGCSPGRVPAQGSSDVLPDFGSARNPRW